jgi:hypothetical protein
VFDGIVPHDVLRVEEVGDGRVRDAQLAVRLSQAPLSTRKENFALSSGNQKYFLLRVFFCSMYNRTGRFLDVLLELLRTYFKRVARTCLEACSH